MTIYKLQSCRDKRKEEPFGMLINKEAWYIAKKLDNPEKSYGASSRDTGTYSIGERTGWLNESD